VLILAQGTSRSFIRIELERAVVDNHRGSTRLDNGLRETVDYFRKIVGSRRGVASICGPNWNATLSLNRSAFGAYSLRHSLHDPAPFVRAAIQIS
jgi:hypothetical protein